MTSSLNKLLITTLVALLCISKVPLCAAESPYLLSPTKPIASTASTRKEARIINLRIPAPRGQIVDRNGEALVQNRVAYILSLRLPQIKEKEDSAKKIQLKLFLESQLMISKNILKKDVSINFEDLWSHFSHRRWIPYQTKIIIEAKEKEGLGSTLNSNEAMPGWYLTPFYIRHYPQGESSSHIIGTLGKVAPLPRGELVSYYKDKEDVLDPLWEDSVGRNGLEKAFDKQLKGKDGLVEMLVDEDGSEILRRVVRPPVPGNNVVSTINLKWQKFAESLLKKKNRRSAMVLLDIENGDIPVLASYPTYNPALFAPSIDQETYDKLSKNKNDPLVARAWQGSYPPGSVFKIPVALAALEKNIFNIPWNNPNYNISDEVVRSTTIDCGTEYQIGNLIFHNWYEEAEGPLNIYQALMRSCNTWFYPVGQDTGAADILSMAHRLGLGQNTGLEILDENAPKLPFDKKFRPGDVANLSIGQGYTLTSPMQIARMISAFILRGRARSFNILKQVQNPNSHVIMLPENTDWKAQKTISPQLLNVVAEGMYLVVNGERGTATAAYHSAMEVAGKTGTAQWGPEKNKAYVAWFTGFFPFDKPRYAFAVMIEGDPHQNHSGGGAAAPIAGDFIRKIFPKGVENEKGVDPANSNLVDRINTPQAPAVANQNATTPQGLIESSFLNNQEPMTENVPSEAEFDTQDLNSPQVPAPQSEGGNPEAEAPKGRNQYSKPKTFMQGIWDRIRGR